MLMVGIFDLSITAENVSKIMSTLCSYHYILAVGVLVTGYHASNFDSDSMLSPSMLFNLSYFARAL